MQHKYYQLWNPENSLNWNDVNNFKMCVCESMIHIIELFLYNFLYFRVYFCFLLKKYIEEKFIVSFFEKQNKKIFMKFNLTNFLLWYQIILFLYFFFFCSSSSHTSRKPNRVRRHRQFHEKKTSVSFVFCSLKKCLKRTVKRHLFPSYRRHQTLPEPFGFFVIWICVASPRRPDS